MTSSSRVFVILLLVLLANAQNIPYPYTQQQYPVIGGDVNNFGMQGYPQVLYPNYPNPYQGYQGFYPIQPPQYPVYPSYPPISYPGGLPTGYPNQHYPGLPQYPAGTNIFPSTFNIPTPQPIQTPFGNIPVEIIDVDENGAVDTNRQVESNGTDTDSVKFTPVSSQSQSIFDMSATPTKNIKYTKTEPSQSKVVRTFDPKGEIRVEIVTPSSSTSKDRSTNKEENDEDNDSTTKKWSIFG